MTKLLIFSFLKIFKHEGYKKKIYLIVDLSKFTFNKKILSKIIA